MSTFPLPVSDLNKWNPDPGDDRYFIVFLSRLTTPTVPSSVGHVFVAWGDWDSVAQECTYHAYGLYSQAGLVPTVMSAFFGPVPGEVEDESINGFQSVGSSYAESLVVEVSVWDYNATDSYRSTLSQEPQPYVLGSNDCISFVQSIASRIGLTLPTRDTFVSPEDYLDALRQSSTAVQHSNDFVGPMIGSLPAGPGTFTYPDGSTWIGPMAGGMPAGIGTYSAKNGVVYTGGFDHGQMQGQGHWRFPDGSTFSGQLDPGGTTTGSYRWPNGNSFAGTIVNGLPNGNCTCIWNDGSVYSGQIVNGVIQGQGTVTFGDGAKYSGAFVNGVANGQGTYWDPNHVATSGNFVNGVIPDGSGAGGASGPSAPISVPTVTIEWTPGGQVTGGTVTPGEN